MKETLALVFRYLHLVGFAGLLGGLLVQIAAKTRSVTPAVRDGALLQLVTGLVLVGLREPDVNHIKIAIKLGIAAVVVVVLLMNRKKDLPSGVFALLMVLTGANAAVAVFWH